MVSLAGAGTEFSATLDDDGLILHVTTGATSTTHRSRRFGRPQEDVSAVALSLTATHLVGYTREGDRWRVRARFDLHKRFDPHDEVWLKGVEATSAGAVAGLRSGRFGQLGLRDLRLVTHADGTPYQDGANYLLSATSAGPGAFATGHASVWAFDPDRPSASTTVRTCSSDDRTARACTATTPAIWSATAVGGWWRPAPGATSTRRATSTVSRRHWPRATADITRGTHVLDTRPLALPTTGLALGRCLGPAPGPHRRWVAGRLRQREEVLQLPSRSWPRVPTSTPFVFGPPRASDERPRAPRWPGSATIGDCWPATAATGAAARTQRYPDLRPRPPRDRRPRRAVPLQHPVADPARARRAVVADLLRRGQVRRPAGRLRQPR